MFPTPLFLHPEKVVPNQCFPESAATWANASSLDYSKLDGADANLADDIADWGRPDD